MPTQERSLQGNAMWTILGVSLKAHSPGDQAGTIPSASGWNEAVPEGTEGYWERAFKEQDAQIRKLRKQRFQIDLLGLSLMNSANHCYINAAFFAVLWALLGSSATELDHLHLGGVYLGEIVEAGRRIGQKVADQPWFHPLMATWTGGWGQAKLQLPDFSLGWGKRAWATTEQLEVHDSPCHSRHRSLALLTCRP